MREYRVVEQGARGLTARVLTKILESMTAEGWTFDKSVSSESTIFRIGKMLLVFYRDRPEGR